MVNRTSIFTRVDAQGNRIPGTSVQRKVMPKVGRWVAEAVNICCFPNIELTYEPVDITDDAFTFTLLCDAAELMIVNFTLSAASTTVDEIVAALNEQLSFLGDFTVSGTDIVFKLKLSISDPFACAGTLSFTVEPTV